VENSDSEVRSSGKVHNAALYRSARLDLRLRIRHCFEVWRSVWPIL